VPRSRRRSAPRDYGILRSSWQLRSTARTAGRRSAGSGAVGAGQSGAVIAGWRLEFTPPNLPKPPRRGAGLQAGNIPWDGFACRCRMGGGGGDARRRSPTRNRKGLETIDGRKKYGSPRRAIGAMLGPLPGLSWSWRRRSRPTRGRRSRRDSWSCSTAASGFALQTRRTRSTFSRERPSTA
jgi:hypothetical protein